jgi:predicted dehydrogenase
MEKKIFTVAIIGVGARGANAYGWQMHEASDRFNVVALCDPRPERLTIF